MACTSQQPTHVVHETRLTGQVRKLCLCAPKTRFVACYLLVLGQIQAREQKQGPLPVVIDNLLHLEARAVAFANRNAHMLCPVARVEVYRVWHCGTLVAFLAPTQLKQPRNRGALQPASPNTRPQFACRRNILASGNLKCVISRCWQQPWSTNIKTAGQAVPSKPRYRKCSSKAYSRRVHCLLAEPFKCGAKLMVQGTSNLDGFC